MIKNWLKQITGVADLEAAAKSAAALREAEEQKLSDLKIQTAAAELANAAAVAEAELSKLSPKDRATKKSEPWVSVLETKVNPDNIRNGFFEMDWNSFFIKELILNGYGTESDPEEEIVDRWFREIVYNMFSEEGIDTSRNSGYINVVPISRGKSEVS